MFIEILFKILLFKGGVLICAEHCICALILFVIHKLYRITYILRFNTNSYEFLTVSMSS